MANKKNEEENIKEEKINLDGIKKELTEYVDEKIRLELVDNIENAHKKVIREKNYKILWRDFLVLLLLGICGFLVYTLYNINYFELTLNKNSNTQNTNVIEENKENVEVVVEPTLDELKSKYSYLIDKVIISDESIYIEDFYNGNMTKELKNYLTLNLVDFDTLTVQDDYNIINEFNFTEKFKELFSSEYENSNFNYNGNSVRYIGLINSYLTNTLLVKTTTNIQREITNIVVNNNEVKITTIEGIVKDNKLFNPITKEEVEGYNNDNLSNYENSLVKITYVFDGEKLNSINK